MSSAVVSFGFRSFRTNICKRKEDRKEERRKEGKKERRKEGKKEEIKRKGVK